MTAYGRDVFQEKFKELEANDEGRCNLADLAEFHPQIRNIVRGGAL